MKKLFLIIILFLMISSVSAQNISVNYPEKVKVNEEFSIKIKLMNFEQDIYDLKIDILSNDDRIARILNNNKWKSTYYYLNDIISNNEEKKFLLKVEDYVGIANITIKIKNSVENVKVFGDYEIEIIENIMNETQYYITNTTETTQETQNITENQISKTQTQTAQTSTENQNRDSKNFKSITLETINLKPKDENTKSIKSKNHKENKNSYAIYGFIAFCILLGILFLIKIKKYRNEFEK